VKRADTACGEQPAGVCSLRAANGKIPLECGALTERDKPATQLWDKNAKTRSLLHRGNKLLVF